jgi:hypothetical protein
MLCRLPGVASFAMTKRVSFTTSRCLSRRIAELPLELRIDDVSKYAILPQTEAFSTFCLEHFDSLGSDAFSKLKQFGSFSKSAAKAFVEHTFSQDKSSPARVQALLHLLHIERIKPSSVARKLIAWKGLNLAHPAHAELLQVAVCEDASMDGELLNFFYIINIFTFFCYNKNTISI